MPDPYRFTTLGPFAVPLKKFRKYRLIDFSSVGEVFEEAERECKKRLHLTGVGDAPGCYILALKPFNSAQIWPYYVGQAREQPLGVRVLQKSDKVRKYKEIMKEYQRATAYIYLLPLLAPSGKRFAKLETNKTKIDKAEQALISMALRVNENLWNVQHRNEDFTIDGTPMSNRRDTKAAASMRRLLGFAEFERTKSKKLGQLEALEQEQGAFSEPTIVFASEREETVIAAEEAALVVVNPEVRIDEEDRRNVAN